ncbi:hypothetical protein FIBSPDRAFT_880285, partial [Athelia psychrophila]
MPRQWLMSGWVCRIILLATVDIRSILTTIEIAFVPWTTFGTASALVCAGRDCEACKFQYVVDRAEVIDGGLSEIG